MKTSKRIKTLKKLVKNFEAEINSIQEECKHLETDVTFGGDTGNYDRSADCYWVDHICKDCEKRFRIYNE